MKKKVSDSGNLEAEINASLGPLQPILSDYYNEKEISSINTKIYYLAYLGKFSVDYLVGMTVGFSQDYIKKADEVDLSKEFHKGVDLAQESTYKFPDLNSLETIENYLVQYFVDCMMKDNSNPSNIVKTTFLQMSIGSGVNIMENMQDIYARKDLQDNGKIYAMSSELARIRKITDLDGLKKAYTGDKFSSDKYKWMEMNIGLNDQDLSQERIEILFCFPSTDSFFKKLSSDIVGPKPTNNFDTNNNPDIGKYPLAI
jgi:hypothetical protein